MFLGSVGFAAAGLWIVGVFGAPPVSQRYPASVLKGIGWFSVIFFGFASFIWARKFFDLRVQLQIGPSGIRWLPWSDQLIPWSEIQSVSTWRVKRQKFIVLKLRNPERFPGQGPTTLFAGTNRKLTGGDICISLVGTNRKFKDAMSAVARFRI